MHGFSPTPGLSKPELYAELVSAADALTAGERDGVANMANATALLWLMVPQVNWCLALSLAALPASASPWAKGYAARLP